MDDELRAELFRRVAVDQEARHALDTDAVERGEATGDTRAVTCPEWGLGFAFRDTD
jgi:hypothetical protein